MRQHPQPWAALHSTHHLPSTALPQHLTLPEWPGTGSGWGFSSSLTRGLRPTASSPQPESKASGSTAGTGGFGQPQSDRPDRTAVPGFAAVSAVVCVPAHIRSLSKTVCSSAQPPSHPCTHQGLLQRPSRSPAAAACASTALLTVSGQGRSRGSFFQTHSLTSCRALWRFKRRPLWPMAALVGGHPRAGGLPPARTGDCRFPVSVNSPQLFHW